MIALGDHRKTGQRGSLQNRPTELTQDSIIFSLARMRLARTFSPLLPSERNCPKTAQNKIVAKPGKLLKGRNTAGDAQGGGSPLVGGAALHVRASAVGWRATCLRRGGNPPAPVFPREGETEKGEIKLLAAAGRTRITDHSCCQIAAQRQREQFWCANCAVRTSARARGEEAGRGWN